MLKGVTLAMAAVTQDRIWGDTQCGCARVTPVQPILASGTSGRIRCGRRTRLPRL
jgi:hypothetical protein